mgnify:CR=1 FL=1
MDFEILLGGALAMTYVAYGFAMTLVQAMQDIDVLSMVSVEGYQTLAVCVGIIVIPLIFVLGEYRGVGVSHQSV